MMYYSYQRPSTYTSSSRTGTYYRGGGRGGGSSNNRGGGSSRSRYDNDGSRWPGERYSTGMVLYAVSLADVRVDGVLIYIV